MNQAATESDPSRLCRSMPPALTPIVLALSLAVPILAQAAGPLPSGGHFVAGAGSIAGNGTTSLTINQTSGRGVIDWDSFSIGSGNHVNIDNGTGATLNRVTGAYASSILGSLSATGSVYLINPQGIVVGRSGVVSTGGRFVASTLDTDNTAFMNGGALAFVGASNGTVVNLGNIASSGGDVFLIASKEVDNVGTLSASKGTAEVAAVQQVLLNDSAAGQQLFVQTASDGKIVNRGTIEAAQISLQAADGNIFALAGTHSVLRATGTATRDAHVWLVADTGRVWLDGTVQASNANGSGGTVDTEAKTLRIAGRPTVLASQWNITTPSFTVDGLAAPVFQSNLDRGTSINLQTTGTGGASGDIDVASSIRWSGAASLTLGAYRSLTIDTAAHLKNSGDGNLTLRADSQAIDNGGSIANKGTVDWSTSRGIVSLFYDMNGMYRPGNLLTNQSWTSPTDSGLVTQITSYKLVNSLADLEQVNADLAGNYALGKDIDASATSNGSYAMLAGGTAAFTGQFYGQGHAINSLTLQTTGLSLGMFGTIGASAVVRDVNISGTSSINADQADQVDGWEGLLAAENDGTVLRVNTSGTISNGSGKNDSVGAGGLVGLNRGTIIRSSSSVDVTSGGDGGLVGVNRGLIEQSHATGQVNGASTFNSWGAPGGLVGSNYGTISQSYATGAVTGGCSADICGDAGGLVNYNAGTITQSYATGTVAAGCQGTPDTCGSTGGLVDTNAGTISQSFATGKQSGTDTTNSFGQVVGPYGIASFNSGKIAGDVYWNTDASPFPGVGDERAQSGASGLTTAQMGTASSFVGYDFGSNGVWAMPAGATHPVLQWQLESTTGG